MSLTAMGDRHAAVDLFRPAYDTRPVSARRARYNDLAHLVEAEVGVRAWNDAEPDLDAGSSATVPHMGGHPSTPPP
jgi:hypothetical protein